MADLYPDYSDPYYPNLEDRPATANPGLIGMPSPLPVQLEDDLPGALSAPARFKRAGIFLSDEVGPDDTVDIRDGLVRALARSADEGWGGPLRIDAPTFGTRTHRLTSRSAGGVIVPDGTKLWIEGDDGALLDVSGWGSNPGATGKVVFTVGSTSALGTGVLLTADITGNTTASIGVASVATFSAGQLVVLGDDTQFTTQDGSSGQNSERIYIDKISGLTVFFKGRPRGNYATASNAKMYPINAGRLRVNNLRALGTGRFPTNHAGDALFKVTYNDWVEFHGGQIDYFDSSAISLLGCYEALLDNVSAVQSQLYTGSSNSQGAFTFGITDTENFTARGCHAVGGNQPFDLSASGTLGISRIAKFYDCHVRGCFAGGFSEHNCQEYVEFDQCSVEHCESGFDIRGRNTHLHKCQVRHTAEGIGNIGAGVLLREQGYNITIDSLLVDDTKFGVTGLGSTGDDGDMGNVRILDSNFSNIITGFGAISLSWTTNLNPIPGLVIRNNRITTLGSAFGIRCRGTFQNPFVGGNLFFGAGTGRTIELEAGDATTAGQGPISPIVRGNFYTSSMSAPLIEHDTGNRNVGDNDAFGSSTSTSSLLGLANTWTAKNTYTSSTPILFSYTADGSGAGPVLDFKRIKTDSAANHSLGLMRFYGSDAAGNETLFAQIATVINDATDGSEDGRLAISTVINGSTVQEIDVRGGVALGASTVQGVGSLNAAASVRAHGGTAIPAGGTAGAGLLVSSTANFGVFFGSGAPSLSAAKGSLYLRSDGSGTTDRAYINTNGSTTWTALTTAA